MVILIWWSGDFSEIAKLKSPPILFLRGHNCCDNPCPIRQTQSVFAAKSPNLMSAQCTTATVYNRVKYLCMYICTVELTMH